MPKLVLRSNTTFTTEVSVRKSDAYSDSIYVRIDTITEPGGDIHTKELFLTPDELSALGKFFQKEADAVRSRKKQEVS